jgi:Family of unknown function (DUF6644)
MSVLDLMHTIEQQPYAVAIAQSRWLFPFLETAHVLALTLVVGSVAMLDLRLLGIGSRERSVSEMMGSVLPWTWTAFVAAATFGLLLFSSKASTYYLNVPFRIKMLCMGLAALNMLVFHGLLERDVATWDRGVPPLRVRIAGGVSLLLWIVIVAAGRWIGFTTV